MPRPSKPSSPGASSGSPDAPRRAPGRPRLTAEALQARIETYCAQYGVLVGAQGLPPFPAGQRETPQHREWMALYRATRRMASRGGGAQRARILELLADQKGRCPICRKPVEPGSARVDEAQGPAALHPPCLELVRLARTLGPEALDRARSRL